MNIVELRALKVGDLVAHSSSNSNCKVISLGEMPGMTQVIARNPDGYLYEICAGFCADWIKVTPFFEVGKTYKSPGGTYRYEVTGLHTAGDGSRRAISEIETTEGSIVVVLFGDSDFGAMEEVR